MDQVGEERMDSRYRSDTEPIGCGDGSYFRVEKLSSQK